MTNEEGSQRVSQVIDEMNKKCIHEGKTIVKLSSKYFEFYREKAEK